MPDRDQLDGQEWERGWDGHARAQQRRLARLSFAEKLAWLEEAHQLALRMEESRKGHGGASAEGGDPEERDPGK